MQPVYSLARSGECHHGRVYSCGTHEHLRLCTESETPIVIGRVAGLVNNLSNGPGDEVWPVNLNPVTAVLGHDVGTARRLGDELTVECHERLVKRLAQITGSQSSDLSFGRLVCHRHAYQQYP